MFVFCTYIYAPNLRSTGTGTVMHESQHLCQATSSSNENSHFRTTLADGDHLNSTARYTQHQQQGLAIFIKKRETYLLLS